MRGLPTSLALVGAGKMGQALLDGWLKLGLAAHAVTAIDPSLDAPGQERLRAWGVRHVASPAGTAPADVILLAIKPQTWEAAAPGVAALFGPGTLLVSVLAGKRVADLAARLPNSAAIVRAMPNTPAAVGRGITALYAGPSVATSQRELAGLLLSAVGKVEWLADESLIDAVTAVSGSGPAYVFHLVEALAAAGAEAGLPAALALRLARATVEGAGELLHQSPETATILRQNVTSPAGTTAAALEQLMHPDLGLTPLMRRAVAAAKRRAEELSG